MLTDGKSKEQLKELASKLESLHIEDEILRCNQNGELESIHPVDGNSTNEHQQEATDKTKNNQSNLVIPYGDLKIKKGEQTLKEREILLSILRKLVVFQLVPMNLIVIVVVGWVAFDCGIFRDVDVDLLDSIIKLIQYYVTAVLVELLGAIVYIVHNVFSDKTIDGLNTKDKS